MRFGWPTCSSATMRSKAVSACSRMSPRIRFTRPGQRGARAPVRREGRRRLPGGKRQRGGRVLPESPGRRPQQPGCAARCRLGTLARPATGRASAACGRATPPLIQSSPSLTSSWAGSSCSTAPRRRRSIMHAPRWSLMETPLDPTSFSRRPTSRTANSVTRELSATLAGRYPDDLAVQTVYGETLWRSLDFPAAGVQWRKVIDMGGESPSCNALLAPLAVRDRCLRTGDP